MIYHKYINDKTAVKMFVKNNENLNEEKNKAFDIQIRHESKIEEEIYERLITESSFSIKMKQASLRHISKKWHQ